MCVRTTVCECNGTPSGLCLSVCLCVCGHLAELSSLPGTGNTAQLQGNHSAGNLRFHLSPIQSGTYLEQLSGCACHEPYEVGGGGVGGKKETEEQERQEEECYDYLRVYQRLQQHQL